MKLTVPHFHHFGEQRRLVRDSLLAPERWDRLRLETSSIFAFHPDPAEWERGIRADGYQERRARQLAEWLDREPIEEIASYGVGPAPVERWLSWLRPQWRLRLGDYATGTVDRLRSHFPEAEVHHHDLLNHPPLPADLHLLCCVDTELSDAEWRRAYGNFAGTTLLIYPCATLGLSTIVNELRQWLPARRPTWCGYWRTKSRIEQLVSYSHRPQRLRSKGAGAAWICRPR